MEKKQIKLLVDEGILGTPLVRFAGGTNYITFNRLSGQGAAVNLTAVDGSLKVFKTIDAAAGLLREVGFYKFEVWH